MLLEIVEGINGTSAEQRKDNIFNIKEYSNVPKQPCFSSSICPHI